jgi:hypothetical protein
MKQEGNGQRHTLDILIMSKRLAIFGCVGLFLAIYWWLTTYSFAGENLLNFSKCLYLDDLVCNLSTQILNPDSLPYTPVFFWVSAILAIVGFILQTSIKSNVVETEKEPTLVCADGMRLDNIAWDLSQSINNLKWMWKKSISLIIKIKSVLLPFLYTHMIKIKSVLLPFLYTHKKKFLYAFLAWLVYSILSEIHSIFSLDWISVLESLLGYQFDIWNLKTIPI